MANLSPQNLLFVKRSPCEASRESSYGEMLGLTSAAFYWKDRLVELEPISPLLCLAEGESGSVDEIWSLASWEFPVGGGHGEQQVDLAAVRAHVAELDA